ncbi:hypothetical protein J6R97_06660 [bacterium]|nr:hypothetical protein [bacterium]
MKAYIYDEYTKEFLYEDNVDMSPLEEDVILMPPNATLEPIGEVKENYAQIFDGSEWVYVEDYRGKTAWKSYNEHLVIEELGAIPEGYSLEQPEPSESERREIIGRMFLTGADVERGIYQAKGMDFDDILTYIAELKPEGVDIKALKIELKANSFYRGNPYVDIVGELLGFSKKQLDLFFETNDPQFLKK